MKRMLLAGVVGTAIFAAGTASAADLPRREAPVAPVVSTVPFFTWTGFYAGVNAGYNWYDGDSTIAFTPGVLGVEATGLLPAGAGGGEDGFTGGGQIGYNLQYGQFVIGVEADINYVDSGGDSTFVLPATVGGVALVGTSTFNTGLDYLGTVRARLGWAFDRTLVYATGGFAYGDTNGDGTFAVTTAGGVPAGLWVGSGGDTRTGWTIGGGVEYAFTNNLTAKIEYLYYDLGSETYTVTPADALAAATGASFSVRQETTGNIVRAGLNYKF